MKIFFYVQHLLGIGHLARASRIAKAAQDNGHDVVLVMGGGVVPGFPGNGIKTLQLPPLVAGDSSFSGLADPSGRQASDAYLLGRQAALLDAFKAFQPDIVITEAFPFGRRQMRFELLPLLQAIQDAPEKPKLLASVRDILQQQKKAGRDLETAQLIEAHYDGILIHGDPTFIRLEETFPLAANFADKLHYTGLVAPVTPQVPAPDKFDIVVSAGGGAVGEDLIQACLEAALTVDPHLRWCLITGPNLPQEQFDLFSQQSPHHVQVVRFREDFLSLLSSARLSISQAGYNTICDVMVAGCRAVVVPFSRGGETEQSLRAERLQALGMVSVISESDLTSGAITAIVASELAKPKPDFSQFNLDGATGTVRQIETLFAQT